jgi:hypothetical protein
MSTYEPNQLLALWKLEKIDIEMVIGHLLQNLVLQHEANKKANLSIHHLRIDMNHLANQLKLKLPSSGSNKE